MWKEMMYPYSFTNVNGAAVEVWGDKTTNSVFHSSGFALYIYISVCVCVCVGGGGGGGGVRGVYVWHLSLTRLIIDGIYLFQKTDGQTKRCM